MITADKLHYILVHFLVTAARRAGRVLAARLSGAAVGVEVDVADRLGNTET